MKHLSIILVLLLLVGCGDKNPATMMIEFLEQCKRSPTAKLPVGNWIKYIEVECGWGNK